MPRVRPPEDDATPSSFPATTPYTHPDQHSFVLQGITQLTSDIGRLSAKVDRLVTDVASHGDKLDDVRHRVSFVRGALRVIGAAIATGGALIGLFLSGRLSVAILPGR